MSTRRAPSTPVTLLVALAVLVGGAVVARPPAALGERPGEGSSPRGESGELGLDVDVLRGEHVEVVAALGQVEANVSDQRRQLDAATGAARRAEAEAGAADLAVDEARVRVDELVAATDAVVIDAFVSPQSDSALDAFAAPSLNDATVKRVIVDRRLATDADLLAELGRARADLDDELAHREAAADDAAARRSEAEAALADVEAAISEQVAFVLAVERRMDHALVEADGVAPVDPGLADEMRRREQELAALLAVHDDEVQARVRQERAAALAAQARAAQAAGGRELEVPGGVVTVSCPAGGDFQVAGDIGEAVQQLMSDAAGDGIVLCATTGYRSYATQVEARRRNCGSSDYAIYSAPASACSPPTARPGTSLHEQGLAIDFTCDGEGIGTGSPCFEWLSENAYDYGLVNLPSEPWHWSVSGG